MPVLAKPQFSANWISESCWLIDWQTDSQKKDFKRVFKRSVQSSCKIWIMILSNLRISEFQKIHSSLRRFTPPVCKLNLFVFTLVRQSARRVSKSWRQVDAMIYHLLWPQARRVYSRDWTHDWDSQWLELRVLNSKHHILVTGDMNILLINQQILKVFRSTLTDRPYSDCRPHGCVYTDSYADPWTVQCGKHWFDFKPF